MKFKLEETAAAREESGGSDGWPRNGAAARCVGLGLVLFAVATGLAAAEPEPAAPASPPVVTGPVVRAPAMEVNEKPLRAWSGFTFNTFGSREQGWKVSGILDDSPAARAGIVENDVITAIDGTSVVGVGWDGFEGLMRGKVGQTKRLTLTKAATGKPATVEVQPKYMNAAELAAWKLQQVALAPIRIVKLPFGLFGKKTAPPTEKRAAETTEVEIPPR
jgi:membrane-associated protease RseP (regulator of RpoE activity)